MPLARETAALLVLASVGASAARAAEPAPTSSTSTASSAPCPRGQGSLSTIACSVAASLLPTASGAEVTVVELKSDRELPTAELLKQRLQASVQSALASVSANPTKGAKLRVELRLEKSGSSLRVTADLTRAIGLWQRLRKTKPRPLLHTFVEVPIDAELRTLIPPPPLVV